MRTAITFLLAMLLVLPAAAITDKERETLQRLQSELQTLNAIINEAEQAANHADREQINYRQLKADLAKIRQGLNDAITSEKRQPRTLPPIQGDYQ